MPRPSAPRFAVKLLGSRTWKRLERVKSRDAVATTVDGMERTLPSLARMQRNEILRRARQVA